MTKTQDTHCNIAKVIIDSWEGETVNDEMFFDGEADFSRMDFFAAVRQRRAALVNVGPGESVIVCSGRGVDFFIDMMAVWSLGAVVVPLAADADEKHIQHISQTSGARLVLDGEDTIWVAEDDQQAPLEFAETKSSDLAALFFTSGSTGKPKGVMLSHGVLLGNTLGILRVLKMRGDRLLINIPFHFTSAICHFLASALSGSTLVGIEKSLFPANLITMLSECGCTCFGGAPVQLRWISEYAEARVRAEEACPFDLRFVMSSGDHLPAAVVERFMEFTPQTNVFTVYGLTELGGRYCILDARQTQDKIGSVGKPIHGLSVHVSDESGHKVDPGVAGNVIASGELLCDGYIGDKERTDKLLRPDGLYTGDIGYLDEDGFLFLTGRSDDVFKVSGKKVSGLVIAEALLGTGMVEDTAVQAVDIQPFGVVPVAVYVPKDGVEFDRSDVLAALRKCLPPDHIPHQFVEVQAIPRTGSGKVIRPELKKMAMK